MSDLDVNLFDWFVNRTFHNSQFSDIAELVRLKEEQALKISVCIPTCNEADNIQNVVGTFKKAFIDTYKLVDELVVIDGGSTDGTIELAKKAGAKVFLGEKCLSEHGAYFGKGEDLWKSLHILNGDIVVWVDADIKNIHPKFVYGLIGPILKNPEIHYVKGFYRRPLSLGKKIYPAGGGRTTELVVKPMFNLFFPQLSGFIQPLSGEYAGRRQVLESIPFFCGYGVETGMLIDIEQKYGLNSMAQVDLDTRIHRNHPITTLSRQAFGIMQVFFKRLEEHDKIRLLEKMSTNFNRAERIGDKYVLREREVVELERPPIATVASYHKKKWFESVENRLKSVVRFFRLKNKEGK